MRFKSVVLDVDSTLAGIEGIDWLAALRGPEMEARSAELTDKAMRGLIPIDAIYAERVNAVKPTRAEIEELAAVYVERIAPGARETLGQLRKEGVSLTIASGGFQQAILPLASELGIEAGRVHAVRLYFDERGGYAGYDQKSSLARQYGKRETVKGLRLEGPVLAMGDGITDYEMASAVDAFAVFTGFVRRDAVIAKADYVVENFDQLLELVIE
jgi:HAD superfamily phosphoserine phosphatase-like hydrolase